VEDVLCFRQESVSRPKNVKVLMNQINEAIDDEKFDDAVIALDKLKAILGEDNSEYKKMSSIIDDAKSIWEM
jgi:hypothetical protein